MIAGNVFPSAPCIIIMGNYLSVPVVGVNTMAASNKSVGVAHHTIVPVNFDPEEPDDDEHDK